MRSSSSRSIWRKRPDRNAITPSMPRRYSSSRHVADAGRPAALDVVVEAGRARAPPRLRALAGAEEEDLAEQVERAAHALGRRVGAEVGALLAVALAGEVDPREVLVERDRDVRIRLVVAQPDVEARLVLADEVLLREQRLRLGLDDEVLDVVDESGQRPARREVRGDALADRLRLAHVDDAAARVAEEVDARLVRQAGALLREFRHPCNKDYEPSLAATLRGVARLGAYAIQTDPPHRRAPGCPDGSPRGPGQGPSRPFRAEPCSVRPVELVQAEAQARPLHPPVGLREAPLQPGRGHGLHERRPREAPGGPRDLHRHPRLLPQQPLRQEAQGVQGAEHEGLQGRRPGLPQGVPVRQDVHAVERGQPRLPAHVPQAEAGGAVLQGDEERLQGLHRDRGRPARLERRQELPPQVPARHEEQGPDLGPAQLQGRQPPPEQGRARRPLGHQGPGLADGDRRDREVRQGLPVLRRSAPPRARSTCSSSRASTAA